MRCLFFHPFSHRSIAVAYQSSIVPSAPGTHWIVLHVSQRAPQPQRYTAYLYFWHGQDARPENAGFYSTCRIPHSTQERARHSGSWGTSSPELRLEKVSTISQWQCLACRSFEDSGHALALESRHSNTVTCNRYVRASNNLSNTFQEYFLWIAKWTPFESEVLNSCSRRYLFVDTA